jgi:ribonuclease HII
MFRPLLRHLKAKGGRLFSDCDIYIGKRFKAGKQFEESEWYNSDWKNKDVSVLSGKVLGCWCSDNACKGEKLIELFTNTYPESTIHRALETHLMYEKGFVPGERQPRKKKKKFISRARFRNHETHPNGLKKGGLMIEWPPLNSKFSDKNTTLWIDEVGMGPLAGPIVLTGIYCGNMDDGYPVKGVVDSKELKPHEHKALHDHVLDNEIPYYTEWVANTVIDTVGKNTAWREGIRSLVKGFRKKYPNVSIDTVVIDGILSLTSDDFKVKTLIGGDYLLFGIALAANVAKYSRDRYMIRMGEKYPKFKDVFAKSKGYGSKQHMLLLKDKKLFTPLHRMSFKPLSILFATKYAGKKEQHIKKHLLLD